MKQGQEQSGISFGVLEMAQALGDGAALRQANRRLIQFHLGQDISGGLSHLLHD